MFLYLTELRPEQTGVKLFVLQFWRVLPTVLGMPGETKRKGLTNRPHARAQWLLGHLSRAKRERAHSSGGWLAATGRGARGIHGRLWCGLGSQADAVRLEFMLKYKQVSLGFQQGSILWR